MESTAPKDAIVAARRRIESQFIMPIQRVHVLAAAHEHLSRALGHLDSDESRNALTCCGEALKICTEAETTATPRQRNQLDLIRDYIQYGRRMLARRAYAEH
jgi:hypothetical protein